jgi:hypothetical protein
VRHSKVGAKKPKKSRPSPEALAQLVLMAFRTGVCFACVWIGCPWCPKGHKMEDSTTSYRLAHFLFITTIPIFGKAVSFHIATTAGCVSLMLKHEI